MASACCGDDSDSKTSTRATTPASTPNHARRQVGLNPRIQGFQVGVNCAAAAVIMMLSLFPQKWSAGPTFTWRILDFSRMRAQIKVANAQQEQALATYEKAVLTSFQDVENALVAYANKQMRYKALNDSVIANRRALEIANELYTTGNGDVLSVLDSERSLFSAEDQLGDSQRIVTENLVILYKALGGGWETTLLAQYRNP